MEKDFILQLPPEIKVKAHGTQERSDPTGPATEGPVEITRWSGGEMVRRAFHGKSLSVELIELTTQVELTCEFERASEGVFMIYVMKGRIEYIHGKPEAVLNLRKRTLAKFYVPKGANPLLFSQGLNIYLCLKLDVDLLYGLSNDHSSLNALLMYLSLRSRRHKFLLQPNAVPLPSALVEMLRRSPESTSEKDQALTEIVLEWIGRTETDGSKRRRDAREIAHQVWDMIDEAVAIAPLPDIAMISESFDLHPDTLSRVFKKTFGIGLKKFIIKRKMEEAYRLLTVENRKVRDVSKRLGYNHSFTFSARFKQFFGYPPSDLKRR